MLETLDNPFLQHIEQAFCRNKKPISLAFTTLFLNHVEDGDYPDVVKSRHHDYINKQNFDDLEKYT